MQHDFSNTEGGTDIGGRSIWPPKIAVCIAFTPSTPTTYVLYYYNDGYDDPGMGTWWGPPYIPGIETPNGEIADGQPSLVNITTSQARSYVAYRTGTYPNYNLYCQNFPYNNTSTFVRKAIDNSGSPGQPSLAVDGNGEVYGAWRRATNNGEIWFAPRGNGSWSNKLRVDYTSYLSQQPFIEWFGDSAFVVWSDAEYSPSDVIRAAKTPPDIQWDYSYPSNSAGLSSESPTQSGREFTNWSEGSGAASMPDINYWIPGYGNGVVDPNPAWWSYWPHSQTAYLTIGDVYHSAWTECPNPNDPQPSYSVLTKQTFIPILGDGGAFYSASAGGSEPSPYLKKRDGVMRFGEKAVDYSRDSLVYELPYLNPIYDYFLKVSSYRETGNDWTQALSVDGVTARSVRFAPNRVDTAWIKIPPELYRQDRKVVFSLKKVRGDYVTSLGLTLYQRDPRRGKGGPQAGEVVELPGKEVFAVYPNPMKDQTQVVYSLKALGKVSLAVYDVLGRLVCQMVNSTQPAGVHKVTWDGKDQYGRQTSSGIYFVKLSAPGVNKTARFVAVR